jgi:hypothetical protein
MERRRQLSIKLTRFAFSGCRVDRGYKKPAFSASHLSNERAWSSLLRQVADREEGAPEHPDMIK